MVTICVDAMGGDEEPQVVLQGIGAALAADADLAVLVAGNAEYVEPFAAKHDRVKALVTTEVIEMGEHPADAVRTKRDSSIVRGCAAVRAGEADGFFSAGSTGAIFAAARLSAWAASAASSALPSRARCPGLPVSPRCFWTWAQMPTCVPR